MFSIYHVFLVPSFSINDVCVKYFLVRHLNPLVVSFTISLVIFLMVAMRITTNIIIYHNLVCRNTNLISTVYKIFIPSYISGPLLCHIIVIQMTSLYIISLITAIIISLCSFLLNLIEEKSYKQKINLYCFFIFIYVVTLTSALHFFMWICFTV